MIGDGGEVQHDIVVRGTPGTDRGTRECVLCCPSARCPLAAAARRRHPLRGHTQGRTGPQVVGERRTAGTREWRPATPELEATRHTSCRTVRQADSRSRTADKGPCAPPSLPANGCPPLPQTHPGDSASRHILIVSRLPQSLTFQADLRRAWQTHPLHSLRPR